jgi:hypothetical protein
LLLYTYIVFAAFSGICRCSVLFITLSVVLLSEKN